jgi:uncharacterized membrane protein YfcA
LTGRHSPIGAVDLLPVPGAPAAPGAKPVARSLTGIHSVTTRLPRPKVASLALGGAIGAIVVVAILTATAPVDIRPTLVLGAVIAVAAGLSATSIGVFGAVLVPGLLLLGIVPREAAPLSLLIQVVVIPLGATSHAAVGHVRREITLPLIVGGVIGSVGGALLASSVPSAVAARAVAIVIAVVGVIVLASLRSGYASGSVTGEQIKPRRVGGIGVLAGFASGISGAGWGPIGVKLLILSRIDPQHAIGSSLVGRVFMAIAAIITYMLSATSQGGISLDLRLLVVLLVASTAAMVPGTLLIARMGRQRASAIVALLSIGLALPSILALR